MVPIPGGSFFVMLFYFLFIFFKVFLFKAFFSKRTPHSSTSAQKDLKNLFVCSNESKIALKNLSPSISRSY